MSTNESETEMTGTREWPTVGNGCECWVNPNPWTYYGIPEPGDCIEYNPYCPEHGETREAAHPDDTGLSGGDDA